MRVTATTTAPTATHCDTIAVGAFDGERVAHDHAGVLQALLDSGEARTGLRRLAVTHGEGRRFLLVGLGARDAFDPESARVAAAGVVERARELGARSLCWELPHHVSDAHAAALVEGTVLAAYSYTEWKSDPGDDARLEELVVSAHHDVAAAVEPAALVAHAVNRTRDLQNAPPNVLTPAALAEHSRGLEGVDVEVWGRAQIEAAGMGAFAAVAQGSAAEPALIVVRYEPAGARGPLLGFVGKAVTFDTGGLAIKPRNSMPGEKFDMSGGAAVLEAIGAIAALGLPVRVLAVVGATDNVVSATAVQPGSIVRAANGTTIEVNNPDAEGRLVLADCLHHAIGLGAERLVDLATLTGGVVVTLGSVQSGLWSSDDDWCETVSAACERAGEPAWRLPLGPAYAELIKGRYADIVNTVESRQAVSVGAAEFLRRFTGDVPWAHLDIAGTAADWGRPYSPKGGSGVGVRTLVELARAHAG